MSFPTKKHYRIPQWSVGCSCGSTPPAPSSAARQARPHRFEPVAGAAANDLPGALPEEVKEERYARLMEKTERIGLAKLAAKVGRTLPVIIDDVGEADEDGDVGATGRSQADAPEIDGSVFLRNVPAGLAPGDIVKVTIEQSDAHDLYGYISEA